MTESLLIGFNKADTDAGTVLIVGKKVAGQDVEVINAFQGEEAIEIYNMLVTKRKKAE